MTSGAIGGKLFNNYYISIVYSIVESWNWSENAFGKFLLNLNFIKKYH